MMREERRNSAGSIIADEELPPAKRFKKARDHNKTLDQVVMMGQQMKRLATQFVKKALITAAEECRTKIISACRWKRRKRESAV
jgi:hypothetical protein